MNAPQKHVFTVFTEGHGTWWPLADPSYWRPDAADRHHRSPTGGRWFERAADGTECDWGRVLLWEPFGRLILSWEISAQFTRDPNLKTEVEVRFIAEGSERTRVELEHRLLENYGEQAGMMQSIFESDGGWTGILTRFAAQAAGAALSTEVACSVDQFADQPK